MLSKALETSALGLGRPAREPLCAADETLHIARCWPPIQSAELCGVVAMRGATNFVLLAADSERRAE